MARRIWLCLLLAAIPAGLWRLQSSSAQTAAEFEFYHEFFGPNGYADPQVAQNLNLGMMNGLAFSPPVVNGMAQVTRPYKAGLMLRLPGAPGPAGISADGIEQQRVALGALGEAAPGAKLLWNLLPEWDQSGGAWVAQGRPQYGGLSRAAAHSRFLSYYQNSYPGLTGYLKSGGGNYLLTAVTDHAANVFDAYEMGADVQMIERGIDELGDLSTGVAYLRGAANQHGRAWGVDISTWRSSNAKATSYAANGGLTGGWSASYLRRHTYASYLAGAKLIQNEASTYRYPGGGLNPFGAATQEFADFALRRHPDLGQPVITAALLVHPDAGFVPKHGVYDQRDAVWYQDLAYSGGDTMTNQFFRLAFPNHWQHGLAPGAPFANAAGVPDTAKFQSYLAAGGDARPYEPMPFTRWGDHFDVINTRVGADALRRYRMIVMLGDVTLDARLRRALAEWVAGGGMLVMNATQATRDDQAFAGVTFNNTPARTSRFSRWVPDDPGRVEPLYSYAVIHADAAQVWAATDSGDPIVTSHSIGDGQVVFTAPAYLEPVSRDGVLAIGVQLLDWLFEQYAPARVAGQPIEYVVNAAPGKTAVALFNHTASEWSGRITVYLRDARSSPDRVVEYVSERAMPFSAADGAVTIDATVPAFDLKVIAVEHTDRTQEPLRKPLKTNATRPFPRR